jgi:hypothetical protein
VQFVNKPDLQILPLLGYAAAQAHVVVTRGGQSTEVKLKYIL